MRHTMKIAVMMIAVVAVVMSGFALAQTTNEPLDFESRVLSQLAPLVEEGVINQQQADAIAEAFAEAQEERRELREERRAERQETHQELLDLLGLEQEELREAFAAGQTLAQIAEAQGVDPQDVIDLFVDSAAERIAEAVDDGNLTTDEAEEKLAEITEKVTDKVNNGGAPGHHRGHRHGRFGGFGPGPAGAPDSEATDTAA